MTLRAIADLMGELEKLPDKVGYPAPQHRSEYDRFVMSILATAYNYCMGARTDLANVVPWGGLPYPWAAANPDDAYRFVAINGAGTYRVSGIRGEENHATMMMRPTGPNTGGGPGPSLGEIDLLDRPCDDEGRFCFLLCAEQPADDNGDWVRLDPRTTSLFCRQVMLDPAGRDTVWAIERLDASSVPCVPSREDTEAAFRNFVGYVPRIVEFNLVEAKRLTELPVNTLAPLRFSASGGMPAQMYFTGMFDVADDELLVLEAPAPEWFRYFGVQLFDRMYNTIDFVAHQSSLNNWQVEPDRDGRYRMFIALRDPGFRNWLDTGGMTYGGVMWRWHTAASFPEPEARRMTVAEAHRLFADSPKVTSDERVAALSARSQAFQARRRW